MAHAVSCFIGHPKFCSKCGFVAFNDNLLHLNTVLSMRRVAAGVFFLYALGTILLTSFSQLHFSRLRMEPFVQHVVDPGRRKTPMGT